MPIVPRDLELHDFGNILGGSSLPNVQLYEFSHIRHGSHGYAKATWFILPELSASLRMFYRRDTVEANNGG